MSSRNGSSATLGPTCSPEPLVSPSVFVKAALWIHGVISLALVFLGKALTGSILRTPSPRERQFVDDARNKIWSLSNRPYGLHHHFITLQTGFRSHYVTRSASHPKSKTLLIFIHGFPDSWHIWRHQLVNERIIETGAFPIAIDIPGYGGSDSLPSYNIDNVCEAVALTIAGLRERYLDTSSGVPPRVIVVSHDWGALISNRLASEAPALADRWIPTNCPHMPVMNYNMLDRLTRSWKLLLAFFQSPLQLLFLTSAQQTISPVMIQGMKSWYIAAFQLPAYIVSTLGSMGHHFFRRHIATEGSPNIYSKLDLFSKEAAVTVASGLGPGADECLEADRLLHARRLKNGPSPPPPEDHTYPPSVAVRAPTGGWLDNLGVYRHQFLLSRWYRSPVVEQSLRQLTQSPAAPEWLTSLRIQNRRPGQLGAPVSFLWGIEDLAINDSLALDNLQDWTVPTDQLPSRLVNSSPKQWGSQVLKMPRVGHWVQESPFGSAVLTELVCWSISLFRDTDTPRLADWPGFSRIEDSDSLIFALDTTPRTPKHESSS